MCDIQVFYIFMYRYRDRGIIYVILMKNMLEFEQVVSENGEYFRDVIGLYGQ